MKQVILHLVTGCHRFRWKAGRAADKVAVVQHLALHGSGSAGDESTVLHVHLQLPPVGSTWSQSAEVKFRATQA